MRPDRQQAARIWQEYAMDPNLQFESLTLHGGHQPDRETRSRAVPIHQTTRDVFDSAECGAATEEGRAAMRSFRPRLRLLGIDTDRLFDPPVMTELATAARSARVDVDLRWLTSPHGHDAFLIEWPAVRAGLANALAKEEACA